MRKDRFNHRMSTFKCVICERLTRYTGQGVDHLCEPCYEIAGIDNMVNDNGPETYTASWRAEVADHLKTIEKRGGNVARVKAANEFLFPPEAEDLNAALLKALAAKDYERAAEIEAKLQRK